MYPSPHDPIPDRDVTLKTLRWIQEELNNLCDWDVRQRDLFRKWADEADDEEERQEYLDALKHWTDDVFSLSSGFVAQISLAFRDKVHVAPGEHDTDEIPHTDWPTLGQRYLYPDWRTQPGATVVEVVRELSEVPGDYVLWLAVVDRFGTVTGTSPDEADAAVLNAVNNGEVIARCDWVEFSTGNTPVWFLSLDEETLVRRKEAG